MAGNSTLWDWFYGYVEGRGKRRDAVIALMNEMMVPSNIWFVRRALPFKYSGPQLVASQNNVAIESIELAHEGVYQLPFVGLASGLASAAAGGGAGGLIAASASGTAGLVG
jgi:hypothetical protein